MKKIIGILMVIALAFIITSCGPNSDYYKAGTKKFIYYGVDPLTINPYDEFIENNEWIKDLDDDRRENPQKYYDVTVEYRKANSNDSFKKLELKDNQIYFENPADDLAYGSYEFKIHFLDKETKNKKEMINYYVVYKFEKSPINYVSKEVEKKLGVVYTLLDNIVELDANGTPLTKNAIKEKYDIVYSVKLNNSSVEVTDGKVSLTSKGTYYVDIQFKLKDASSGGDQNDDGNDDGNDGNSGASNNDGSSGASSFNDNAGKIILLAAKPLLSDGVTAATSDGDTGATPGSGDEDGETGATPGGGDEVELTNEGFIVSYRIIVK